MNFLVQGSGEKPETLPRLHSWAGEDDPAHLSPQMGRDSHRHRQVGLAGPSGANAKNDIVFPDGVDVALLAEALGSDRTLLGRDLNYLALDLPEGLILMLGKVPEGQLYVVGSDGASPLQEGGELADHLLGNTDLLLRPADGQEPVSGHYPDVERILHHSDMLIVSTEEGLHLGPGR